MSNDAIGQAGAAKIDVLVVDDDPAIVEFLEMILADRGYRVRTALDGRQAMEILTETKPRLVLLDLSLPELSGWDLAKAVRESETLKEVRIVVMSAHSEAPEEADSVGAADYLCKPFEVIDLLNCVATHAGRRG